MDPVTDPADWRILLEPASTLPPLVAAIALGWAFVVGACWGSFLNVVIARVPEGVSIVRPRSRCPACNKQIEAKDNIPLLSWVLLRAKCRNCQAPISARYPFVELLMGLAAMAVVARHGFSLPALELFTFIALLVAIAFVDLDTWTVPNPLWIALVASGFGFGAARSFAASSWDGFAERAIGAVGAGLFLGAVVVLSTAIARRTGRIPKDEYAMGWGDPLIMIGVGAFLGWRVLPLVIFFASVQGTVVALTLAALGKLSKGDKPVSETDEWVPPKNAVPFGPFLALGALEAAFFGDVFLARYLPLLSGQPFE